MRRQSDPAEPATKITRLANGSIVKAVSPSGFEIHAPVNPDGSFELDVPPSLPRWLEHREAILEEFATRKKRALLFPVIIPENRNWFTNLFASPKYYNERNLVLMAGVRAKAPFTLNDPQLPMIPIWSNLAQLRRPMFQKELIFFGQKARCDLAEYLMLRSLIPGINHSLFHTLGNYRQGPDSHFGISDARDAFITLLDNEFLVVCFGELGDSHQNLQYAVLNLQTLLNVNFGEMEVGLYLRLFISGEAFTALKTELDDSNLGFTFSRPYDDSSPNVIEVKLILNGGLPQLSRAVNLMSGIVSKLMFPPTPSCF